MTEPTRVVQNPLGMTGPLPATCNQDHKKMHELNITGSEMAGRRVCICEGFMPPNFNDGAPVISCPGKEPS